MTDKETRQNSHEVNHSGCEDEISLIDLIRVIWKWKWFVIAGTLVCAVAAALISFQLPEVYEITMSIEPGIIGVDSVGNFQPLDNPANIGRKINEGIYNRQIIDRLNINSLKRAFKFKTKVLKNDKFIKIRSQWEERNVDLGLKASTELFLVLAGEYQELVEQKKGGYANLITMKKNEIKRVEAREKLLQANHGNIGKKKEELAKVLKINMKNIEDISRERDFIKKNRSATDKMTLLLYATVAQQNMLYFNQLNNQLYDLNYQEQETKQRIEELAKDLDDINLQLNNLKQEQGVIRNIQILQAPEVSSYPVKPKKDVIIAVAAMLGFLVFLFLAFFIEYIRSASKKSRLG